MAAQKRIFLLRKKSRDQNLKNHFAKEIFKWNLAQSKRTWIHLHSLPSDFWRLFLIPTHGEEGILINSLYTRVVGR